MSFSLSRGGVGGGLLTNFLQAFVVSQKRISTLVTLALIAASAWILGEVVWHVIHPQSSASGWVAQSVTVKNSSSDAVNTGELLRANLFGQYSESAPAIKAAPEVKDAPKTRLNLILVGVVSSSNPDSGLAVISNGGVQSTYGVGEEVEGTRAKLKAVLMDRVIIDNSGRDETLMLEGIEYRSLNNQSSRKASSSMSAGNNSGSKLEAIRSEITKDPQKLLQYIQLSQLRGKDGKLSGYRVRPGKDRVLFEAVGLKNGDIATHLNGEDLTDPAAMGKIWQSISELTEVNLTVERDGQVEEIFIQF